MKKLLLLLFITGALSSCSGDGQRATNSNGASGGATTTATPEGAKSATGGGARDAGAVRVVAPQVSVAAGAKGEAVVRVEIGEGFHVNANPPSNKYLIGTRLEVAPSEGVRAGAPVYPAGLMRKFAFEKEPLSVYEGAALIKLPLDVDASAAKGIRALPIKVEVQPCNDQECFPPRTLDAAIQLTVN